MIVDPEKRKRSLNAELANGRLAMVAILFMWIQDVKPLKPLASDVGTGRGTRKGLGRVEPMSRCKAEIGL